MEVRAARRGSSGGPAAELSPRAEAEEAAAAAAALGRCEQSLRSAVRELQAELAAFKRGVEQQVAEVLRLAGPLPPSLAELQRDNRQLRAQVERLARQVEDLARSGGGPGSPTDPDGDHPPRGRPFGGRVPGPGGLALRPGRSLSLDLEDWKDSGEGGRRAGGGGGGGTTEPERSGSRVLFAENGQQHQAPKESAPGLARLTPEPASSPLSHHRPNSAPEAHAPAVTLRMPHQPVTAVTKVSEIFSGETVGSPVTPYVPGGQHANSHGEAAPKASSQAGEDGSFPAPSTVKTWTATSTQKATTVSSERFSSVTKSMSAASYESTTTSTTGSLPSGAPPRSLSPPPVAPQQTERRRELVRSQTLPRTSSAQARKALFEKFEQETGGKGKGGGRPKLKRSQSLGVTSASGIKQILLDWCRSKTVGYKHIDLQNFSGSWSDGMAFCALVHSFFPEAFDYQALEPGKPKENFELAFTTAEKMAGCDRLIEVEDMLAMGRKPDPMCVFTYVQSLYNHLRRFE